MTTTPSVAVSDARTRMELAKPFGPSHVVRDANG